VLSGLAALIGSAYQVLRSNQDDARTVAHLVNSVLRPLAGALPASGEPQEPREPLVPQEPSPALWQLAVTATSLRARLAAEAPPGLLEAVAALQDLAVREAPAGERADRIATLEDVQRALPPGIVIAKNGPYLVTNVPVVRTPLGERVGVPPQLALCRCGSSSDKPFCDGTHAAGILERLRNGTMPCDGAWPAEKIQVFRRWTQTGFQP
jgi:Iron-binding zinc finger CDGSH type